MKSNIKIFALAFLAALSFNFTSAQVKPAKGNDIHVTIDIDNVKDDKVAVTMNVPKITADKITFHIPKIIPGTYSEDDYGRFLDDVKAYDAKGNELAVAKANDDSWDISNAGKLAKITYLVNDTFDIRKEGDVFSPAGTNILDKTNFMLNLHGFVGYFTDMMETPYEVTVMHPATLFGATSATDTDPSDTKDVFNFSRYFEVTDHPIMYSKPNYVTFTTNGVEVLVSVYSPSETVKAKDISPELEKMMRAQKNFLGDINKNKKYAMIIYLTDLRKVDANGYGALEHNSSTTVVLPEMMPKDELVKELIDVISHEFFHTVTPLSIHSKEIQYFDYTTPKMSEHLWMYEGVTEYFSNLFQVNQGLITEDAFYKRIEDKISNATKYDDTMPFTKMSANVLVSPYKAQYNNVYEKGALIGMCLDILIREKSNGQRGVLDLMKKLSAEYGPEKPFNDNELFAKIIQLTYPEVGDFLKTYVDGTTPIPYAEFLAKVGVAKSTKKVAGSVFVKGTNSFITVKPGSKDIVVADGELNDFFRTLNLHSGDVIESINGQHYNLDTLYDMIMESQKWNDGDDITMAIKRNGKEMTVSGKVKPDYKDVEGYMATDHSKDKLRQAWLKG